jgi:alpha-glucosidase (family GH31 glycosyl hydrolase)
MVAGLAGRRTARLGGAARGSRRFVLLLAVTALAACGVENAERPWPGRSERAAREPGLASETSALPATALCPPAMDGMPAPDLRDEPLAAVVRSLRVWDRQGVERVIGRPLPAVRAERSASIVRLPARDSPGELTVVVRSVAPGTTSLTLQPPGGWEAARVGFALPLRAGERIYGLGERFGPVDARGQVVELWAQDRHIDPSRRTSHSPMPLLISSRRYAVLLDTTAHARVDVGATAPAATRVEVDVGALRVLLIRGADPKQLLRRVTRLTGRPPLVPRWGLGVWKNLIGGEERVLADLERLCRHGVPIDAVWIYDLVDPGSGFGWRWPIYRPIPPGPYRDPARLVRRLHAGGVRVLGYLSPFVDSDAPGYAQAAERGYLVADADGRPIVRLARLAPGVIARRSAIDFTDPSAAAWFEARVRRALVRTGFDGAMQDFGEGLPPDAVPASGEPAAFAHNRYPTLYSRAVRRAAQDARPDDTVFFARAGAIGSQSMSTGRFTGDQQRSWDPERGLPSVLEAMINGSLSGWPYWGPDIAGFTTAPDDVTDERELWLRWLQLGALSPVMRDMLGSQRHAVDALTDHGTLTAFRAYARLHTALEPYLHRAARVAHRTGLPIIRPLFLEHPDDDATYDLDDQYLLGPDILVAPVLRSGARSRMLYLPEGTWRHYWTGRRYDGGRWISVAAPVTQIPLFTTSGFRGRLPTPAARWRR